MKRLTLYRLVILCAITVTGFGCKFYRGPWDIFVANKLAGLFYVSFWCVLVQLATPRTGYLKICTWVLLITSLLEFMQLLDFYCLEIIRSTFVGQSLLGNSFSWSDFVFYILGTLLSIIILRPNRCSSN